MPDEKLQIDRAMAETLDRIREQHGLDSREEAAEMLIKRRLGRGARQISMRGRALHLIRNRGNR